MPCNFATSDDHARAKRGRPTDYTPEIAMTICEKIGQGESLRSICAGTGMPDRATVFRWLAGHEEFRAWYAFARESRMDELLYEAVEIADACALDLGNITVARLRINARLSELGRRAPKKYGAS